MLAFLMPCISTLLLMKPDADLFDLHRFYNDKRNQDLVLLGTQSPIPAHREFFLHEFKNGHKKTKEALSIKLQTLLNNPIFAEITTGKSTLDLEKLINQGKVIIFDISKKLFEFLINIL